MNLTHFDQEGQAIMVDVSAKELTERTAKAQGKIYASKEVIEAIKKGRAKKGDVLGVARVAGIMATKKTSELIPMCHPLMISKVSIDFEIDEDENYVLAKCTVKCSGQTGVEMEALTGVTTALLTIYDMTKALDKSMHIEDVKLMMKSGGVHGDYEFKA